MNNLFLTGKVGIGKSTVLKEVLKRINLPIGGYVTERIINGHIRTYTIKSLYDGVEKFTIARVNQKDGSKKVFIDSFDTGILSILNKSLKDKDVIVLDELGFMEDDIDIFTSKIYELLDSEKIILGILKKHDCKFLNNIRARDDVIIVEITKENRDSILNKVLDIMRSFNVPLIPMP